LALARRGARLALLARRRERLEELARLVGGEPLLLEADVAADGAASRAVEAVVARFGRIDTLINNAGVMATARFHEQPLEEVERVARVNYLAPAALCREALRAMLAQGGGHIVNVASMAGLFAMPYMASYAASKHALAGLTEALRREYRGTGVTLTLVCPGSVETPMTAGLLADPGLRRLAWSTPVAAMAARIADCCEDRRPELVYGEAPGFLVKLAKLFPRTVDWAVERVYGRSHPLGRTDGANTLY
jgi:short-subunit dehydrogenase